MTIHPLSAVPAAVTQSSLEDITWGIDVSKQLTDAEAPTLPVTVLTRDDEPVNLADPPTVNGNIVRQRIRAGTLAEGNYRLSVRHTPSGTTNVLETILTISCPH